MILDFIGFIAVLENEDIEIIKADKLLVPSFVNKSDNPDDIYPKLERLEGYVNIMQIYFTLICSMQ